MFSSFAETSIILNEAKNEAQLCVYCASMRMNMRLWVCVCVYVFVYTTYKNKHLYAVISEKYLFKHYL